MTRPVTEAFPLSGAHATFQWPRSANGPDAVRLPERLVDFSALHHGPGLADLPGQAPLFRKVARSRIRLRRVAIGLIRLRLRLNRDFAWYGFQPHGCQFNGHDAFSLGSPHDT